MRLELFLIAILSLPVAAHAADGYVAGAGKQDCRSLQEDLSQQRLSDAEFQQWLLGYFSGTNVAYGLRSKRSDVTTGATVLPSQLAELVIAKCLQKPDLLVSKATDEVYTELRQLNR